jgi:hypothetical protein
MVEYQFTGAGGFKHREHLTHMQPLYKHVCTHAAIKDGYLKVPANCINCTPFIKSACLMLGTHSSQRLATRTTPLSATHQR